MRRRWREAPSASVLRAARWMYAWKRSARSRPASCFAVSAVSRSAFSSARSLFACAIPSSIRVASARPAPIVWSASAGRRSFRIVLLQRLFVDGGLRPRPGGLSLRRLEPPPQLLALALQPLPLPREGCRPLLLRVLLADRQLYGGGGQRLLHAQPLQKVGAPARRVLLGLRG